MGGDRKEEEMIYGLTADERDALHEGLNSLPDTPPPRMLWERIREQAEAEGLLKKRRDFRSWYAGAGLAAAVVMAVMMIPQQPPVTQPDSGTTYVTPDATAAQDPASGLQQWMIRSAQLEQNLRALPETSVVRAGTAATIIELEDRIAAIDYQLSDPDARLTPAETEIFWRERVRLMESLVQLRYAQAQRTSM
ncbi:MAG: hypothetical protein QNI99_12125 [Woeseiaceae bacterium]|nr:hypothetical protein [Woeseiaceae bacterium]